MQRVFTHANPLIAGQVHELLDDHHIPCHLRNHFIGGAAGEIPPTECWPEVWVIEDRDTARAQELVQAFMTDLSAPRPAWTCPGCGEWIEGQFDSCWSCGEDR